MRSLKEEAPPSSLGDKLIQIGLTTPPYLMIPLALLATGLLPLPFDFVAELFLGAQPIGGPGLGSHGVVSALIVGCLIAPLAETALNQWACITLLRRKCGVGRWMAILLSSALFASMHFYSWKYVITTFPVGLVLGYVYVVERIRLRRAFWIVTMIHSSRNAISIALVHYLP
ncbi:CPBP family intramembrane metalloprotease [Paraburkholderia strydomiana]|uniref:CPBP family intramembrane glutamic endopeptidase n=1 Tax=Paraburkholderia strydomiana TaxID=1245417 RepID=UPI0038BB5B3F